MSDTRRRRKSHQSGGSDDMSDSYEEVNTTKETQSSEYNEDHHDSEYDTAGSESDTESQDKVQRESGDGQEEEKPQKKLDDDEDRRNPQYIPKRGTFYEHDDRTADEINEEVVEEKPEREVKDKKVWKDKEDRWDHDRYNDEEQAPKSHAELIAVYGYDIRNEEGPPRARRRRRYGRGPNKYTRNWEDEDAYGKVTGSNVPPKPAFKKSNRTSEEFPVLNQKKNETVEKTEEKPVFTSAWYSNKTKQLPNKTPNFPALQQSESQKAKPKQFGNSPVNETRTSNDRNNAWKKETKNTSYIQNVNETSSKETDKIVLVKSSTREIKKPQQPQEFASSMIASKGRGRGFKANTNNNVVGSRTIEQKPKSQRPGGSMSIDNRRSNVEHEQVINEYKHANISSTEGSSYIHAARQNKQFYNQPSSQQHSGVVPPRMQQPPPQQQQQQAPPPPPQQQPPQSTQPPPQQQDITASRPKRYSSLRQRPNLPEGPPNPAQPNYPPAPPQHTYYPPPPPQAGSSRAVLESPGYAPSPYEQQAPVPAPGQPVMQIPPPGAQPAPGYVPHTHAPPPFLVPPPQFIASQTAPPNIINYVPGPNGHIFQPNYQSYSPAGVPVNLEPGPPPQEVPLYQPQGCTYYNAAQQQQQQPQPVPLRRPKAAIPILPPPENQNNRGRNRQSQSQLDQQQQEQLLQQQQQQEQLVRQQLQQRQQQLIQQQQQELQQQQEKLKQQQQQQQHQHQQQQHQPQQPEIIQYSQNDSQNIPQLSDQTTNDSRSNVIIMTDPNVNLEEKLRNVTLNETTNPNNEDQTLEVTEVEVSTRKKELVSTGIVESDHVEEKLGISAAQTIETDKTSISTGEKSELDCVVQDSTVINKAAA